MKNIEDSPALLKLRPKHILVIDDDQSCNFILREFIMLENQEVDLTECYSVDSALEHLESSCPFPDVIFLDLNMPVKTGFDFLDEYSDKYYKLFKSTQLIVLTSSLRPSDRAQTVSYECVTGFESKSEIDTFIGEIVN